MRRYLFIFSSIVTVLMISGIFPSAVSAQLRNTDGEETGMMGAPRVFMLDARSVAMGDATIADYTDLTTMNLNPATLSFVRNPGSVYLNTSQMMGNNLLTGKTSFPVYSGTTHRVAGQVGFHYPGTYQNDWLYDQLNITQLPEPEMELYQVDIAYAWSYENIVSIGLMNNLSYTGSDGQDHWAYSPAVGVVYVPSPSISYGIVFRGPGTAITYQIDEDGNTELSDEWLRNSLEIGASFLYPVDTDETYLALSLSNEKRFGESGLRYKGGLEAYVTPYIALRTGIIFQSDQALYTPRFGFGIGENNFRFDYALSYKNQFNEHFHQIGLSYRF